MAKITPLAFYSRSDALDILCKMKTGYTPIGLNYPPNSPEYQFAIRDLDNMIVEHNRRESLDATNSRSPRFKLSNPTPIIDIKPSRYEPVNYKTEPAQNPILDSVFIKKKPWER
ncbi:hypothetical protein JW826_00165 [Candidatus Woesearchaeota archaeon]|nr:hypothetical protein [Candidatus Woesearchaeota archaeon]